MAKEADERAQRMCRVCKQHMTTMVCSHCLEYKSEELFVRALKTGRSCLDLHIRGVHQLDV